MARDVRHDEGNNRDRLGSKAGNEPALAVTLVLDGLDREFPSFRGKEPGLYFLPPKRRCGCPSGCSRSFGWLRHKTAENDMVPTCDATESP